MEATGEGARGDGEDLEEETEKDISRTAIESKKKERTDESTLMISTYLVLDGWRVEVLLEVGGTSK